MLCGNTIRDGTCIFTIYNINKPDISNLLSFLCQDERTALHECARSQQSDDVQLGEICRQLIKAGSDINANSSDWGEVRFLYYHVPTKCFFNVKFLFLFFNSNIIHDKQYLQHILVNKQLIMIDKFLPIIVCI